MTVHKFKQPHMIYEGPRPRRAVAEPATEQAPFHGQEIHLAVPRDPARDRVLGLVLLVAVTLGVGIGIGFWLSPGRQPAKAILPAEAAAPSVTRLVGTPPPPIVVQAAPAPVADTVDEARHEPVAAPLKAKAAARAADRPQRVKASARNDAVKAAPEGGCRPDSGRAEVMLCADPAIAAADEEMQRAFQRALKSGAPARTLQAEQKAWLIVREQAAQRSPDDLAGAYEARVNELNAIADDPPH